MTFALLCARLDVALLIEWCGGKSGISLRRLFNRGDPTAYRTINSLDFSKGAGLEISQHFFCATFIRGKIDFGELSFYYCHGTLKSKNFFLEKKMAWIAKLFLSTDQFILRFCTRLAHLLQRTMGITSYLLAKNFVVLSLVVFALDILNFFLPILSQPTKLLALVGLAGMLILTFPQTLSFISEMNKVHDAFCRGEIPNIAIEREQPSSPFAVVRVYFLMMQCLRYWSFFSDLKAYRSFFLEFFDRSLFLFVALALYFMLVRPLPPGTTKVGEWVKGFRLRGQKLASQKG